MGVALGVRLGLMVGDSVGLRDGQNVGFDVGEFVGHSRHPAQTVNPHLRSQEAGLDKQNASQSHTQKKCNEFVAKRALTAISKRLYATK